MQEQEQEQQPLLLKIAEAARLLGVGRTRVHQLVASRDLPYVLLGSRSIRIPADGLAAWVKARSRVASDPPETTEELV